VNFVDQIPVLISHVFEGDVTQNSGVVDEDVDSSKVLDSGINDGLAILNAIVVGNGFTASLANLFDDNVGGLFLVSLSCFPSSSQLCIALRQKAKESTHLA